MDSELVDLLKNIVNDPDGIYVYTNKIKQNKEQEIWCSCMNFDTICNNWNEMNKLAKDMYDSTLYYYEKTYYPGDQESDIYIAAKK